MNEHGAGTEGEWNEMIHGIEQKSVSIVVLMFTVGGVDCRCALAKLPIKLSSG